MISNNSAWFDPHHIQDAQWYVATRQESINSHLKLSKPTALLQCFLRLCLHDVLPTMAHGATPRLLGHKKGNRVTHAWKLQVRKLCIELVKHGWKLRGSASCL